METLFWVIQRIIERVLEHKGHNYGTVLMCHEVSDKKENWYNPEFSVRAESLKVLIRDLLAAGYVFKSVENITGSSNKDVFLTFDDGFSSVYEELYPFLKRNKVPFCVFVTTNYINKAHYMTDGMLKEIIHERIGVIGAHTLNHPILRKLKKKEAEAEIGESKRRLEQMLGVKVEYFAYPYGCLSRCSLRNIRQVKRSGYKKAFSTLNSAGIWKIKYFIPRQNVSEDTIDYLRGRLLTQKEDKDE